MRLIAAIDPIFALAKNYQGNLDKMDALSRLTWWPA